MPEIEESYYRRRRGGRPPFEYQTGDPIDESGGRRSDEWRQWTGPVGPPEPGPSPTPTPPTPAPGPHGGGGGVAAYNPYSHGNVGKQVYKWMFDTFDSPTGLPVDLLISKNRDVAASQYTHGMRSAQGWLSRTGMSRSGLALDVLGRDMQMRYQSDVTGGERDIRIQDALERNRKLESAAGMWAGIEGAHIAGRAQVGAARAAAAPHQYDAETRRFALLMGSGY